eukprot:6479333-Amphidinium_carterae.1
MSATRTRSSLSTLSPFDGNFLGGAMDTAFSDAGQLEASEGPPSPHHQKRVKRLHTWDRACADRVHVSKHYSRGTLEGAALVVDADIVNEKTMWAKPETIGMVQT